MRKTIIKGIDTDYRIEFIGDVDLICAVKEISTGGDEIAYEAELTGEELLKFLNGLKLTAEGIQPDKNYIIRAYDW